MWKVLGGASPHLTGCPGFGRQPFQPHQEVCGLFYFQISSAARFLGASRSSLSSASLWLTMLTSCDDGALDLV